jgi:hypothetical protein
MIELGFVVARCEICNRASLTLTTQLRLAINSSEVGFSGLRVSTVYTRVPVNRREARKLCAKPSRLWRQSR